MVLEERGWDEMFTSKGEIDRGTEENCQELPGPERAGIGL